MNRRLFVLMLALLAGLLSLVGRTAAAPHPIAQPLAVRLTGTLNIVSGDRLEFTGVPVEQFALATSTGESYELRLDESVPRDLALYRLYGREVIVTGNLIDGAPAALDSTPAITVSSLEPAPAARAAEAAAVTGNTKWVSIACKFADIADEPQNLSFFQNMYGSTYPGLDAYWREASYDNINLQGSTAVGWFTLPKPMSAYQIDAEHIRLTDLLLDCAAQADPVVDFNEYSGINLMLNGNPACCAWGGNRTVTLDGTYRNWSVTWLPPWSYANLGYVQHEMTHGYGILWHSYANDNAYGDPWDVVSDAVGYWPNPYPLHPVYRIIGQHTQAYHRDYLGWIPSNRVVTVGEGKTTFSLEQATRPGTGGYLLAVIPIDGSTSHFYALEARRRVGFDKDLLDNSISIHEIGGPRHLVQLMDPWAIGLNWGRYVWKVDDTWTAPEGGITVHVDSMTASGFVLTVHTGLETRSLNIPIVADTYIEEESPLANFGDSPLLRTRGFLSTTCEEHPVNCMAAFLRFESHPLPANIAHAWVRVTHTNDPISGYLSLGYQGASPNWEENSLTWSTVPEEALTTFWYPYLHTPTVSGANWKAWDISGLLSIHGSHIVESLMVDNGTLAFSSREGDNPPQLIIEYLVEPPTSETHTFTPTNDAHVMQARPNKVYGAERMVRVKDAARDINSYVKFNIKSLTGTVDRATLRLYVTDSGPDYGKLYAVSPYYKNTSSQWLETGLNWRNAPLISGTAMGTLGKAAGTRWIEIDVTQAVIDGLANNNGRVSFAVSNDSRNQVAFSSKEGAHPPELVVVTTP